MVVGSGCVPEVTQVQDPLSKALVPNILMQLLVQKTSEVTQVQDPLKALVASQHSNGCQWWLGVPEVTHK
jgi:hypothetical protein